MIPIYLPIATVEWLPVCMTDKPNNNVGSVSQICKAASDALGDADVGFGPPGAVSVSVPDGDTSSGLRVLEFLSVG